MTPHLWHLVMTLPGSSVLMETCTYRQVWERKPQIVRKDIFFLWMMTNCSQVKHLNYAKNIIFKQVCWLDKKSSFQTLSISWTRCCLHFWESTVNLCMFRKCFFKVKMYFCIKEMTHITTDHSEKSASCYCTVWPLCSAVCLWKVPHSVCSKDNLLFTRIYCCKTMLFLTFWKWISSMNHKMLFTFFYAIA